MSEEIPEVPAESDLPEDVEKDLKSKHGELITICVEPFGAFAFCRLSKAASDLMANKLADQFEKAQAIQEAVLTCLCYPYIEGSETPDHNLCRQVFKMAPDAPQKILLEVKELAPGLNIKKL